MNRCIRLVFLLAVVLCCLLPAAAQMPQTGQLKILLSDDETVNVYSVAVLVWDEDNYVMELTEGFSDCAFTADQLHSPAWAKALTDYAGRQLLPAREVKADGNGEAELQDMPLGIYLVCSPDDNFYPFLVSVPECWQGAYLYQVVAKPKQSDTPEQTEPTAPGAPVTGDGHHPGFWLGVNLVSFSLLAMLVILCRKRV